MVKAGYGLVRATISGAVCNGPAEVHAVWGDSELFLPADPVCRY